jgi:hypothetical protein
MTAETYPWAGALLHTWVELLTLFAAFAMALALITAAWNRPLRPAERGPVLSWSLLVPGFGLLLLLRHWADAAWQAIAVALAVVLAGLLARIMRPFGLWLPVALLAALLGLGLHLSALLFTLFTALALLFSADRGR